jgi:hypothetical protein
MISMQRDADYVQTVTIEQSHPPADGRTAELLLHNNGTQTRYHNPVPAMTIKFTFRTG